MEKITSLVPDLPSLFNAFTGWVAAHGFQILTVLGIAIIVNLAAGVAIERVVRRFVPANKYGVPKEAERKREDTLIRIVHGSVRVLSWILAALIILSEIGVDIGPLLAAAGVVGLALGFGGQYLIKDLISGFFIILENQYRIGDVVCFGSTCGLVEDVTLRSTILRDLDGTVHHVPHGSIERVANLSKQFARVNIDLRISYTADLEEVIALINETGRKLAESEEWKDKLFKPVQFERVESFDDSAVVVKVLGETPPLCQWEVAGEFRKRIKIAFDKAGIEIPFPHRVVHIMEDSSQNA